MATFTCKQQKKDNLKEKIGRWVDKNYNTIETACDLGILGASAVLMTVSLYYLGKSNGFSQGLKTGYSIGVVEGEHNILSKMAMTVVDKAKDVM